jgi:maltoporin
MKKPIVKPQARTLTAAILLALGAASAHADVTQGEFHGYFRAGAGSNSEKGSQACFGLNGVAKYRYGNECDTYGEFSYTKELAKSANGTQFVGTFMPNFYEPDSGASGNNWGLAQMFVEARNVDFLNGATAWVGKRFYNRPDIHVLDLKMVHMDGTGFGIDGLKVGPGQFGYALMRNDAGSSTSATRHHFLYHGLPANTAATFDLDATLFTADTTVANSHGGYALSVAHKQGNIAGGDNSLWLQYAQGAGVSLSMGQVGSLANGSDVTQWRVGDQLIWSVSPNFTGGVDFIYQSTKSAAGTTTWTSIGARPTYALSDNLKLILDAGHDRVKPAGGGATQQLTKVSFGPALTMGKGFWSRPELRAFVTYAKWNDAAQAAATPGSTLSSTGVFGNSTNGTSYGVQVESWF